MQPKKDAPIQSREPASPPLAALPGQLTGAPTETSRTGCPPPSATAFITLDAEGVIQQCNRAAADLLGYGAGDLLEKEFGQVVHPGDQGVFAGFFQALTQGRVPFSGRVSVLTGQGAVKQLQLEGEPLESAGGERTYLLTALELPAEEIPPANGQDPDPTQVAAALRASEARLREAHGRMVDILERTTDAFYALDAHFRFTYVNQRAAQLWGRDRDALIGRHYWSEFPKAVGSDSYQKHYQALREGQPVHYETVSPLLGIWIDVSVYPGSDGSVSVFFRDITARKQAQKALQVSEARQAYLLRLSDRLRQLVDPVAIQYQAAQVLGEYLGADRVGYAEDQGDGQTITVTRNYTRGVAGVEGRYHYDVYGPELLRAFQAGRTVVRSDVARDPSLTDEEKAAHASLQLGATVNKPILKAGRLVAVLFVHCQAAHDWSAPELTLIEETAERIWAEVQRARAEAALRESEARCRLMVDAVPINIWITDAEGKVEYLNQHWCDYCGVECNSTTASEIAARFLHPEDGPKVMEVFQEAMQTGTP